MKFLKRIIVLLLLVMAMLMLYLLLPQNYYIRLAIINQQADIDDYKIFENREVIIDSCISWQTDSGYINLQLPDNDNAYLQKFNTVAFLIICHHKIVFEQYYNGYSDSSYSNSFSIAKSIVGMLAAIAVSEGNIKSFNDKIYNYIPELKESSLNDITVNHLLNMSSGINWNEQYKSLFAPITQMYYGNNIKKQMLELKAKMKPGCEFEYLSCNTQLLSMVIEKATGKTLTEYASEKLWGPLGACHNALWSLDKTNGSEKAYCCFNTNARDFARIGQLILDTGKVGNHQILPASFVEKIYTPDTLLIDIKLNKPNKRYSHNFWVSKYNNTPLVYARGIGGQCIIILPAYDMVIVRLGEKRDSVGPDGHPKDIYQFARIATQLMN